MQHLGLDDEIVRLRNAGRNRIEIAAELGCSVSTVHFALERKGAHFRRRKLVSDAEIKAIIEHRRKGLTQHEIASLIGCTRNTIKAVLKRTGGNPPPLVERSAHHLSFEDREVIFEGIIEGVSNAEIARRINKHPSNVGRELKRNGGRQNYRPVSAERRAQQQAHRPKEAKLVKNAELCSIVEERLAWWWSPQIIAETLRDEYPDNPEMWVSHETIYQSLFIQGRGALRKELHKCSRTGRAQRKPRGRTGKPGRITNMVMISERPAEVEDRAVPGHWEGDLIVGKNSKSAVATLVERSTRYVMLCKISDQRAETVKEAIAKKILELPAELRKSLTWDQGKEMAAHVDFTIESDVAVYFCDPHSPWQRGSNEMTNGLLRQYMPKGTDLSIHSQTALDAMALSLNTRPRITLGLMTPLEKINGLIALTG